MATGVSPLTAMVNPTTPNLGAAPASEPGLWSQIMGGIDTAFNDPLKMALLTGGLGLLSNQNPVQALQGAGGAYQQILQRQAQASELERKAGLDEENLAINKAQLEQGQQRINLEKDKLKAAQKKLDKASKTPTGANDKLWKQALDTVLGETELEEPLDTYRVYEVYNTLAGDGQDVYPVFGTQELSGYLDMMTKNPTKADALMDIIGRTYGPKAFNRMSSAWAKASAKLETEKTTAEDDTQTGGGSGATGLPTDISPLLPVAQPKVNPATNPAASQFYQQVYPTNSNSVWYQMGQRRF